MKAIDIRREFKNAAADAGYTFWYDPVLRLWALYKEHPNEYTYAEYFTIAIMKHLGVEQFKEIYLKG